MRNYFNYFTEIEERFQQRRGTLLMLSTLDWVLIETWREAGLPLEVVLRGIDTAFDHFNSRQQRSDARGKGRLRRVNGLAWCAQAVLESAEQAARASLAGPAASEPASSPIQTGFEPDRITRFLRTNADLLAAVTLPEPAATILHETTTRLRTLATDRDPPPAFSSEALTSALAPPPMAVISTEGDATRRRSGETCGSPATKIPTPPLTAAPVALPTTNPVISTPRPMVVISTEGEAQRSRSGETRSPAATEPTTTTKTPNQNHETLSLEELDRALASLEERLVAALQTATPEPDLLALREQAARELAPYKSRMGAVQIRQLQQQFLHKRLLEQHRIPRLSLFYMGMA